MRMMITCEKAAFLISKKQDKKLSMKEDFQLRMHLLGCRFCRAYERDIGMLSDRIRQYRVAPEKESMELPHNKKQEIKHHLRDHGHDHGHDHSHSPDS